MTYKLVIFFRKKTELNLEKLECSSAEAQRSAEQEKSIKYVSILCLYLEYFVFALEIDQTSINKVAKLVVLGPIYRAQSEEKIAKLREALRDVQNAHIKEMDEMNEQLQRQRERSEELTEMVSDGEMLLLSSSSWSNHSESLH